MGAGEKKGVMRIAKALDKVHRRTKGLGVIIDLETTAGQGTNLGYRFEHLARYSRARGASRAPGRLRGYLPYFRGGLFPGDRKEEYDETIEQLDRSVGLDRLRAWHLNDSCRECGSRVDRHAGIGAGQMGLEPFRHVVNDPRFRHLPMILETPKGVEQGEDLDAAT